MPFVSLLLVVIFLSGCASFNDPEFDFDKPLVPRQENKANKPKEERSWVEAKTGRVWVNPHVDESGDLVEGHYKNTVLEPGHWAVKEN